MQLLTMTYICVKMCQPFLGRVQEIYANPLPQVQLIHHRNYLVGDNTNGMQKLMLFYSRMKAQNSLTQIFPVEMSINFGCGY